MEKSQLETKRRINALLASAPDWQTGRGNWAGEGARAGVGAVAGAGALALFLSKSSLIKCSVFTVEIF